MVFVWFRAQLYVLLAVMAAPYTWLARPIKVATIIFFGDGVEESSRSPGGAGSRWRLVEMVRWSLQFSRSSPFSLVRMHSVRVHGGVICRALLWRGTPRS